MSLVSHAAQSHPVQSFLIPPAPLSQPARSKRKRCRDSEAEADEPKEGRSAKQPRRSTGHRLEPSEEKLPKDSNSGVKADESEGHSAQPQEPPPLADKDSQSLQLLYDEVMTSSSSIDLKRTSSRRSMILSETGTNQTQRSSSTNAVYRHKNLAAVKIRFHAELTDGIETTIKGIVNAEVSEQRRAELRVIAQEFCDSCLSNVRAETGEDDFIDPLHTAIKALRLKSLRVREKAAWRWELKPVVRQQSHFSSSFMASVQQLEADDTSVPPRKRQHQSANENHISPEASQTNIPTPPANSPQESSTILPPVPTPEKEEDRSPVKTPHPDLSMGIDLQALISALSSQNLSKAKATKFIEWLQNEMVQHEKDGPFEPMLLSVPAPRALDLTFPFAVVEGKAYSTGKQIFEAENQAAVSLACAHKILICLDRMVNPGTTANTQPHVLYSITTQGPIHELWVHWTVVEDGVRIFDSKLWDSWNGLVPVRAEDFIVKLNNVCVWGTGPFTQSVVESLGKVAVQAET